MTGGEIAAIIGGTAALLTALGAIVGMWLKARADRLKYGTDVVSDSAKQRVDHAAVLLGGWEKYASKTLEEVDRVREECEKKIAELKREHDEDRAEWQDEKVQWYQEKARMQAEIDQLRAQYAVLIEAQARRNP